VIGEKDDKTAQYEKKVDAAVARIQEIRLEPRTQVFVSNGMHVVEQDSSRRDSAARLQRREILLHDPR
jgi:hypothetical protein